ncbi:Crp/Fnr family transcription regulator [Afipia sp. P52-10]|uniref:Crp/Fnr family transcriptional regulator n=1 Tax=Afipia sp. P52-10 TaxID=1429916 RepID=UPI0003DF33C5|nr:Crp/Fnr family transcriptional regulator [Afipia sp. P52-10]ETR76154.1 Crp/Fnr family transcription regulator [Afipia sp. P52-10]
MLKFRDRTTEAASKTSVVQNKFLATMSPEDFDRLRPFLKVVELKRHAVINEANKPAEAVYFIESGVVSRIARTQVDGAVEVAMVGRYGFLGISVVLGTMISLQRSVVQIPGFALRISASDLQAVMTNHPAIREHLLRYVQLLLSQKAQVVLCNAKHEIDKRLARWLLLAHDRISGNQLQVTHDLLAMMLGVRRAGVTEALAMFESKGVLAKARGAVRIVDQQALKAHACECYKIIDEKFSWLRTMQTYEHRMDVNYGWLATS